LRREVIATVLANAMVNSGGPAFVSELMGATSAGAGVIAGAFAAARDVFGLTELEEAADSLDNAVAGETQLGVYASIQALLKRSTLWFLRNAGFEAGLSPLVARYAEGVRTIRLDLDTLLTPSLSAVVERRAAALGEAGLDAALARRFAELPILSLAADAVLVAEATGAPVADAAAALFGIIETFRLAQIIEESGAIVLPDHFDRMALDRALANLARAQRDLSADVLAATGGSVDERLAAWRADRAESVDRTVEAVRALTEGGLTVSRLSVAAGLLSDLARAA
jgi:glutamate dehydrogenase